MHCEGVRVGWRTDCFCAIFCTTVVKMGDSGDSPISMDCSIGVPGESEESETAEDMGGFGAVYLIFMSTAGTAGDGVLPTFCLLAEASVLVEIPPPYMCWRFVRHSLPAR